MSYLDFLNETLHVYLDESSLKIAKAATSSGKKIVTGLYYKDLAGLQEAAIALEIQSALKALGTKMKRVHLVLGTKYVITKTIEVPSLDDKEIEDIVRLQAVRHTPYSKEEVVVGNINLEVVLERYTKSLLVIAADQNVRRHTDQLELGGCEIEHVHASFEALTRAACERLAPDAAAGFVHLDAHSIDFIIAKKGKPYFVRSLPIGQRQLKKDIELSAKALVEELKKSIEAYQAEESGPPPAPFYVLGITSPDRAAIRKILAEDLKIEAVEEDLDRKLPLSEEAKNAITQNAQISFLDVIGDALSREGAMVDLVPEDLKVRKSFRAKGQEIIMGGAFFMAIFILTIGIFFVKIYFRSTYLDRIKSNYEVRQKEANELVAVSEETRLMKIFESKRARALTALNHLQSILPEEMYLSEMSLAPDEKVTIKGTSDLMSSVFSFVTFFENDPLFKGVTTDFTKSRKENDRDVSDFGLSASLDTEAPPNG